MPLLLDLVARFFGTWSGEFGKADVVDSPAAKVEFSRWKQSLVFWGYWVLASALGTILFGLAVAAFSALTPGWD